MSFLKTLRLIWFLISCALLDASWATWDSTLRRLTDAEDHWAEEGAVCDFSILKYFFFSKSFSQSVSQLEAQKKGSKARGDEKHGNLTIVIARYLDRSASTHSIIEDFV
jgi:hypothetical protein